MYAKVLKANPYHDHQGRFATSDGAKFVSIGGVFDRQRASQATRASAARASTHELHQYVDFDAAEALAKSKSGRLYQLLDPTQENVPKSWDKPFDGISDSHVQSLFSEDRVSVYMAMKGATVKKILEGDTIKNSLQTGKGTFKKIGEERAILEKASLGVKADVSDPESFPKYGFVAGKGAMDYDGVVAFGYGDVYVEFDDSIRKRSTVTIGDSYNSNSGGRFRVPAPIDEVGTKQFAGSAMDHSVTRDRLKKATSYESAIGAIGGEYAEAQIYGKLDAQHIKAIHVESKRTAKSMEAALKKKGLNIKVTPTNSHTYLAKVWDGQLEAIGRLSPDDVSKLGQAYHDKIWSSGTAGSNLWAWRTNRGSRSDFGPKLNAVVAKYPSHKDVPASERGEIIREYLSESRKGAAGKLDKVLWTKKAVTDGFVDDVFNEKLLKEYR